MHSRQLRQPDQEMVENKNHEFHESDQEEYEAHLQTSSYSFLQIYLRTLPCGKVLMY